MEIKNLFAQDSLGNILPGATCTLLFPGTSILADGLQKADGTPLTNPFKAGDNGLISLAAPNGLYDLQVVAGSKNSRITLNFKDPVDRVNLLTKSYFGRYKPYNPNSDYTTHIAMELEADFLSVRIGIPNIHSAAVTGVKASVGLLASDTSADWQVTINPTEGTWVDLTFGGASSVTLPARTDTERASITFSDFVHLKSLKRTNGIRPIILIRVEYPSGSVVTVPYNGFDGWRSAASTPRILKVSNQTVLGVTDKAAFTQTTNTTTNGVVPIVQYVSQYAGRQAVAIGDSTVEGLGNFVACLGATTWGCLKLSTPTNPYECFNGALHSQVPELYQKRLADIIDLVRPTVVVYSPYSINAVAAGGMTDAVQLNMQGNLGRALATVRNAARPSEMLLLEGLPCNPEVRNTGAGDQKRRDFNLWLRSVVGATTVVGYAAAISAGENASGQTLITSTMTNDNVHPNLTGYDALSNVVVPYLNAR